MEKDEILRKAQGEKVRDEMELQAEAAGGKLAFSVGIVLCMALMAVKIFTGDPFTDMYAMLGLMASVPHFYCWKKLNKKEEFWNGLGWCAVGLFFLVIYLRTIV